MPSPRIRLVAFQRVRNIAPKASVPVELRAEPSFHSVVVETSDPYRPTVQVEAGPLLKPRRASLSRMKKKGCPRPRGMTPISS